MILVAPEHLPIEASTEVYKAYWEQYKETCKGITGFPATKIPTDSNAEEHFEAMDCFGVLSISNFHFTFKHYFTDQYQTLSSPTTQKLRVHLNNYDHEDTVFVISWLDFTSLSWQEIDWLFKIYKGKILLDDSFESCPIRNNAMNTMLEKRGYNVSKIGWFTNCPRKDLTVKEDNFYRNNWLHLTLTSDQSTMPDDIGTINPLDKAGLKDYSNKTYQFLSLNGHSTSTRLQVILKLYLEDVIDPNKFRYSMCSIEHENDVVSYLTKCNIPQDNNDFYKGIINQLFPKRLPGDVDEGRERDFFVSADWWNNCYFNLNIDTNQAYLGDNWVNISEKWMKQIMYYTPGININEYTGLEQHAKDLGFKGYEQFWDQSYDTTKDHYERINAVVDVIKNMQDPTEAEWKQMMDIAEYNYNHFYKKHIPSLAKSLQESIQNLLDQ